VPGPLFFVDRSLGRVRVPALLRESGWALVTLSEHYGVPQDEAVDDVAWLRLAGERGWPVLMKDERIKYRTAERRALIDHGVRAFCVTSGNLNARAWPTASSGISTGSGLRQRESAPPSSRSRGMTSERSTSPTDSMTRTGRNNKENHDSDKLCSRRRGIPQPAQVSGS
jgi:hypothetical protein